MVGRGELRTGVGLLTWRRRLRLGKVLGGTREGAGGAAAEGFAAAGGETDGGGCRGGENRARLGGPWSADGSNRSAFSCSTRAVEAAEISAPVVSVVFLLKPTLKRVFSIDAIADDAPVRVDHLSTWVSTLDTYFCAITGLSRHCSQGNRSIRDFSNFHLKKLSHKI